MDTQGDHERLKLLVALPSGRLVGRKGLGAEGAAFLEHLAHKRQLRVQQQQQQQQQANTK